MTGFLEVEETDKRQLYYKSPLLTEPASKIDWSDLIEKTEEFVREKWPEISSEYVGRFCGSFEIVDPFSGDNIELGERAKTALDVSSADYPKVFKTAKDAECKDFADFLTNAEGDYDEEEYENVKQFYEEN